MKYFFCAALLSISLTNLYGWKSAETKGTDPIFFGTLSTQEGNTFYVTNVSIGTSREGIDKVVLYEKPKNLAGKEGNALPINPHEDLTTTTLELMKVSKITVPEPHTLWTWTNSESKRAVKLTYEFIELVVTWRSGSSSSYLLELGPIDTKNPVKIFCDVIDKQMTGVRQDGTLFCSGVKKTDLRKKGAPFQAIKELVLEEPCYKVPQSTGTLTDN